MINAEVLFFGPKIFFELFKNAGLGNGKYFFEFCLDDPVGEGDLGKMA